MKNAVHLLTYDIGTTGAKTCLFRLGKTLELMETEVVGYPLITTADGGSEQRVDDWWKAICQGSHTVLSRKNCPKEKIAAISFCCQMQALVEVGEGVVGEGCAVHETAPPVERERRFEGGAGAGLKAHAGIALGLGMGDDRLQQSGCETLPQKLRMRPH